MRFTVSVPHGKPFPTPFMAMDMRYLAIPPTQLPAPTASMFFSISDVIVMPFVCKVNINLSGSGSIFVVAPFYMYKDFI